jgi:ABC-type glycerol-3-phosphate transport system permease component
MGNKKLLAVAYHLFLLLVSVVMIVPLYWTLKTSFTGENLFIYPPSLIPKNPNLYFYVDVYNWVPFLRYFFNSVFVSMIVIVANIVFNSMAAYGLRYRFRGKRLIIVMYLGLMMIPFHTSIIPAFLITRYLGLLNSYLGLAFPLMSTIINIFVFKASFDAVPQSLFDAALIDGVREWKILFKIYLPLSTAAIATCVILTFVWSWNNFIWPLIIISEKMMETLPLSLSTFVSYFEDTSGQLSAFVVMVVAPIIIVFLMNQNRFMSGMMSGAIKG